MKLGSLIALTVSSALLISSSPAQSADDLKGAANAAAIDSARLSPDLLQVAKLVQSSVDENVVLAYVEKNPLQRSPTADELVYLKNLGLSGKAMIALMNSSPKATSAATVQAPYAVQSAPVAPAVQVAPVQPVVVTPPVVYAPANPPVVYAERPYVDYSPAWSFGLSLGHHIFGHHGFGHHHGGHHWGHHGGHHRRH